MRIKAYANGDVIDADEETATVLIDAGIYEAVQAPKAPAPPKTPPKAPPAPKKTAPEKSTKVEPMTTEDMPAPVKQVT